MLDNSALRYIIREKGDTHMAWLFYLVALILWNAFGLHGWAIIAFLIGMGFHWKYWSIGIVAFLVGLLGFSRKF